MVTYKITGLLYNSKKRFTRTTENFMLAMGINLWRGSVWKVTNGKKKLIKRVIN
jgi:hypothetical protein